MEDKLIALIKQEVVPALGCTEPIAVALAVARAAEELRSEGFEPVEVDVAVSVSDLRGARYDYFQF